MSEVVISLLAMLTAGLATVGYLLLSRWVNDRWQEQAIERTDAAMLHDSGLEHDETKCGGTH